MTSTKTKDKLKSLCTEFEKAPDAVIELFKGIIALPVVASQEDPEDIALKILKGRLINELSERTEKFTVYIFSRSGVVEREGKDPMQWLEGIARGKDGRVAYCRIGSFRENAHRVEQLEEGVYEANLNVNTVEQVPWVMFVSDSTAFTKVPVESFPESKKAIKYITQSLPLLSIPEALKADGEQTIVVEGQVIRGWVTDKKDKQGKVGFLSVFDDSMTKELMDSLGGGLKCLVRPFDVRHPAGSVVYVIGRMSTHEKYGKSLNGNSVLLKYSLGDLGDLNLGQPTTPKPSKPDEPMGEQFTFDGG